MVILVIWHKKKHKEIQTKMSRSEIEKVFLNLISLIDQIGSGRRKSSRMQSLNPVVLSVQVPHLNYLKLFSRI